MLPEKCLLVGLGEIGMGYDLLLDPKEYILSHARAINLHSGFELIGAVDLDRKKRELFEKAYSKPVFNNLENALQNTSPSIVVISTPTNSHLNIVVKVLSSIKPKVILCEKPLSYDLDESRKIVELCEKSKVSLFVNYMRRVDPGAVEIFQKINSKFIADGVKGLVWYSKGFLHNASHFFNLLEFWLGDYRKSKLIKINKFKNSEDFEVDALVEFEKGSALFQSADEDFFSHYTIELLSKSGRLRYEYGGRQIIWQGIAKDLIIPGYTRLNNSIESIPNNMNYNQYEVFDHLSKFISGEFHYLCTGHQALKTLESMHDVISQGI